MRSGSRLVAPAVLPCDPGCSVLRDGVVDFDAAGRINTGERASVYVLKMGQPVRIYELAERMIRLAGFEPGEDIDITVIGTRPGERLHEILFAREEPMAEIGIDGVMAAKPVFADRARVDAWLDALERAVEMGDRSAAERVFEEAVPEFKRRAQTFASAPPARPVLPQRAAIRRA